MTKDDKDQSGIKPGAGALDFDEGEEDDEPDESEASIDATETEEAPSEGETGETAESEPDRETREPTRGDSSRTETASSRGRVRRSQREERVRAAEFGAIEEEDTVEYPYFVRRNKVGDERTERIDMEIRPEVQEGEAELMNKVARMLGTESVAKTDVREYAMIVAQENWDLVAERMIEDGYGKTS